MTYNDVPELAYAIYSNEANNTSRRYVPVI